MHREKRAPTEKSKYFSNTDLRVVIRAHKDRGSPSLLDVFPEGESNQIRHCGIVCTLTMMVC